MTTRAKTPTIGTVSHGTMRPASIRRFDVYWSPEGRVIATVDAVSSRAAIRKAPHPYRRFLGELYAVAR